jgi:hypothetical protein
MPNLQNLLKRRPVVEELDPEVHARLRARLASLHEPEDSDPEHDLDSTADPEPPVAAAIEQPVAEVVAPIPMPAPTDSDLAADEEAALPANGLDTDGWDADAAPEESLQATPDETVAPPFKAAPEPDVEMLVTAGTEIDTPVNGQRPTRAPRPAARIASVAPTRAVPPPRRTRATPALVACPYCAEPLKTPPVASGKCPRCRLRIVVKRVGDRAIYLTEAALPVFMAERRRAVHAGRWTLERDRWLELAMASGVEPASVTRLARMLVSEDVIAAARNLYMSSIERSARAARRERRWEDAARLRAEQSIALYRIARYARPVPAEVLAVHRDGLASSLRGIAEVAKSAELRAAPCCETCRADDGRTVRIADELRSPSVRNAQGRRLGDRGPSRPSW